LHTFLLGLEEIVELANLRQREGEPDLRFVLQSLDEGAEPGSNGVESILQGLVTAISIIDTLDEIIVVPYISSANKEVDTNKPVTVAARIVKAADGSVLTPTNPTYKFEIYDGDTWQKLASSTSSSINVETSHTDKQDGTTHDVEVLVTVEFDSLN
jgi:hypothetical protein